jgi:HrpA-like RNA helicase
MNPLTNIKYSKEYYKLKKKLSKLPIYQKENIKLFEKKLDKCNILILVSGTGSGKSIGSPILALKHYNYRRKIILTQPRTVNIEDIASFIALQLDVKVGEEVGFMYGRGKKYNSKKNKLLVIIDSIYVRIEKLFELSEPNEEIVRPIIFIDEIHERSIYMDLILTTVYLMFKNVPKEKHKFLPKVVLLSATINPQFFINYYSGLELDIELMQIEGVSQKINHIYLQSTLKYKDILSLTEKEVEKLIKKKENYADILVFLPTLNNCIKMSENIQKIFPKNIFITPLSRKTFEEDKKFIIDKDLYKIGWESYYGYPDPLGRGKFLRRVIFSTPIAETGLTIAGLKYVIDTGFENVVYLRDGKKWQKISLINKPSVIQRCGRTGRTEPGTCIHMYSYENYEKFPMEIIPKIYKTEYHTLLLNFIKIYGTVDEMVYTINFLPNKLNKKLMDDTILELYELGVLSENKISKKGEIATDLGIDVKLGNLIISSFEFNMQKYMIPIAIFLHIDSNPQGWSEKKIKPNKYGVPITFLIIWYDFLSTFLKIYGTLVEKERFHVPLRKWCKKHQYNYYKFKTFLITLNKMESRLHQYKNTLFIKVKNYGIPIPDMILYIFMTQYKERLQFIPFKKKYKIVSSNELVFFRSPYIDVSIKPFLIGFTDIIYRKEFPPIIISPFVILTKEKFEEIKKSLY